MQRKIKYRLCRLHGVIKQQSTPHGQIYWCYMFSVGVENFQPRIRCVFVWVEYFQPRLTNNLSGVENNLSGKVNIYVGVENIQHRI